MRSPLARIDISPLKEEGDFITFIFSDEFGQERHGFVLLWEEELRSFENRCPHWKTPLNTHGDGLLHRREGMLVCHTHGALFRPDDGYCVIGPCEGDRLTKLELHPTDEEAIVEVYRKSLSLL